MMFRKPWLISLALLLTLLVVLLTVFVYRSSASIPHIDCNAKQSSSSPTTNACPGKLLVFSKTGAFRHASIKDGKIALQKLAAEHNFAIDFNFR